MTKETILSGLWHKTLLVAAALCLSASVAMAAEPFPSGGTIIANTDYTLGTDSEGAVFYPATTGQILYTVGSYVLPYDDADHTQMTAHNFESFLDGGTYSIKVTQGVPVYFFIPEGYNRKWAAGQTFRVSENQPIKIVDYTTRPGGILSITDGFPSLDIDFNQPVHASSASLAITGTSYPSQPISMSSTNSTKMAIAYKNIIQSWFNSGALQGGEDLTLTIKGIVNTAGVFYNNGEDLVINYKAPQKSVIKINDEGANPFYSYWKPGDPNAVLTIKYSGNISKADYLLTFGNFEAEVTDGYAEYGSSNDPSSPAKVTIEGNVVKIDFAGKQRRPQDMVPSGTNYNNLVIKITSWDETGEPTSSSGQGTVGSFEVVPTYIFISPAELNTTFVPESGGTLKDVQTLTINLFDYDKIDYTGVKFEIETDRTGEYTSVIVPKSQVTASSSGAKWTLSVPVPAEARTGNHKVVVTLDGLDSTDGVDHSLDLRAVYDGFTITYFELWAPDGSGLITTRTLPSLKADTQVLVLTNVDEQYPDMYIEYSIVEVDGDKKEVVKTPVWMKKEQDGPDVIYTQTIPMDLKMVRGREYQFIFEAWTSEEERNNYAPSLGTETYIFKGSSEPFRFSSIVLDSVDPADGTEIEPTATTFTLNFSGLVKLDKSTSVIVYGQGITESFESLTPVDSQDGYSNIWIATIPDSYIASYGATTLDFSIVATDENGLLVEGNVGSEENSYIALSYPIAGAALNEDYYVTPSEGIVENLTTFTVGCLGTDTGLTYDDQITINLTKRTERGSELIYSFSSDDMVLEYAAKPGVTVPEGASHEDDRYYETYYSFTLPTPVTEEGVYILSIPEGFFFFGSMFDVTHNAVRAVAYEIGEPVSEVEYSVEPAEGSVTSLSTITITFTEETGLGSGTPKLIINGTTEIKLEDAREVEGADFWDPILSFTQELPETYTTVGTYEIVYPAGYFQRMDSEYPEIKLTYAIGTIGIENLYGDIENINVYSVDGRQLVNNGNVEDIKDLENGLYVINGRKVFIKK